MTKPEINHELFEALSSSDAAQLLWSEWEYRHSIFWNSLYRWGFSAVAVTIAPYVKPDLIKQLDFVVLVFPIVASLLAIFASWHIGAEYIRLVQVSKMYKKILGEFTPDNFRKTNIVMWFFGLPIGWVVPGAFLFLAFVVETINVFVLISLV